MIDSERAIQNVQCSFSAVVLEKHFLNYEYAWGYEAGKEFMRGKEYYTQTTDPADNVVVRTTNVETAFDGERSYFLRHDWDHIQAGLPSRGGVRAFDGSAFTEIITPHVLMGYFAREKGRLSCGEAIRQAEAYSLKPQMETIDGHLCYVLEALGVEYDPEVPTLGWDFRVWIDPQRGFRPLQAEKYVAIEGENRWKVLNQRVDSIVLKDIGGTWFPVAGTSHHFGVKSLSPPPGMSRDEFDALPPGKRAQEGVFELEDARLTRRVQVDPESVRINKGIPPESFVVTFPLGCRVYDEFIQSGYVVGGKAALDQTVLQPPNHESVEDGPIESQGPDARAPVSAVKQSSVPEEDAASHPAGRSYGTNSWMFVLACIAALGVFAWLWRARLKAK
jgi:hypothetical protein